MGRHFYHSIKLPFGLDKYITLFVSVALMCFVLEKDSFIEYLYFALSCPIKLHSL